MRAAVMRDRKMLTDSVPDPEPGAGEVLVKTLACGICGSDLHALQHADRMAEASREAGQQALVMDPGRDVVMGHEFCAEVLDHGPGTQKTLKAGTRVCSMPLLLRPSGILGIGYSNEVPGGFAEYMVLNEMLLLELPNGLSTECAALTEPMAVGLHAVEKAQLGPEDVALVVGCGPVGLSVIAALELAGVAPLVAADFSPRRRALAEPLGAAIVVDPAETSPYASFQEAAAPDGSGAQASSALDLFGPSLRPAVIFECVGVPGVIQQILSSAPRHARGIIAGVCMETDRIEPLHAVTRELTLQFVLGYTPEEFARTLRNIAEGRIPVEPLITGRSGLDGVAAAFEELANPERHAKIVVEPWRSGT